MQNQNKQKPPFQKIPNFTNAYPYDLNAFKTVEDPLSERRFNSIALALIKLEELGFYGEDITKSKTDWICKFKISLQEKEKYFFKSY